MPPHPPLLNVFNKAGSQKAAELGEEGSHLAWRTKVLPLGVNPDLMRGRPLGWLIQFCLIVGCREFPNKPVFRPKAHRGDWTTVQCLMSALQIAEELSFTSEHGRHQESNSI